MKRRLTLDDIGETATRKQAAEILGVSEWTVYRGVVSREIPKLPFGRRILIPKSYLEDVLGRSTTTTTTSARRRNASAAR